MRIFSRFLMGALALACLCACSSPCTDRPKEGGGSGDQDAADPLSAEVESLFTPSTDSSGNAFFDFETRDSAYITDRGYTLWALRAAPQDPFVSRTVVLNKLGGNPSAGYGLVFCSRRADAHADETMLVAMIDAQQEYAIGEAVGSTYRPIVSWTYSPLLKLGYGQANELGLSLDGETRVFTLSINGEAVAEFSPMENDYYCGGGNGYLAVISPEDDFPRNPVHIIYQEK
jgi:hypothetical protein